MTCIVGVLGNGKTYVGADSMASNCSNKIYPRLTKVFHLNGRFLIGVSGSGRVSQLLRFGFEPPTQKDGTDDYEYMCTEFIDAVRKRLTDGGAKKMNDNLDGSEARFLVAYRNHLYEVESNFQIWNSEDSFMATGTGLSYALGSLWSTKKNKNIKARITLAIEAASQYCPSVGGPIVIEELEHLKGGKQ